MRCDFRYTTVSSVVGLRAHLAQRFKSFIDRTSVCTLEKIVALMVPPTHDLRLVPGCPENVLPSFGVVGKLTQDVHCPQ